VVEEGTDALKTGRAKLLHFGVADETAWEVGLACGGSIDVFVQPLDFEIYKTIRDALVNERPLASATVVKGPAALVGKAVVIDEEAGIKGTLGEGYDEPALAAARAALAAGQSQRLPVTVGDEAAELFVEVLLPSPVLIAVGGVHTSIALTALAKSLGYRTVVVDPRKAFGSADRFPHVDQLIQEWPDDALKQVGITRSTAIAMLTHDPKLDDPGLKIALTSPAFYVGALGSQNTQAKRRQRLREEGITEAQLARLRGPIGLDLGGRTPEEIALAILAEIVAARNGRLGPEAGRAPVTSRSG
jgi:xanthine dehydrogenase accessory factor